MRSDLKQPSPLTAIVADQSPAMRRTCRKIIDAALPGATQVREASTLHAVRVLLRETSAGLVVASDELAGGDGDLTIEAIRDAGAEGRIVLIAGHASGTATASANWSGAVEIVPRARVAEMLPALIEHGCAPRADRVGSTVARSGRACDDEIVPFHVAERRIIETAIRRAGGNIGKAARALEISPSTIYRKIQVWHADHPA
jgi:DNA-binding NtrC family response regulator